MFTVNYAQVAVLNSKADVCSQMLLYADTKIAADVRVRGRSRSATTSIDPAELIGPVQSSTAKQASEWGRSNIHGTWKFELGSLCGQHICCTGGNCGCGIVL